MRAKLSTGLVIVAVAVLLLVVLAPVDAWTQTTASGSRNSVRTSSSQPSYGKAGSSLVIYYAGGPVMSGSTNVYVIYYGPWGPNKQSIIDTWLSHIGGTSLFGINTTYHDSTGAGVQNVVTYNSSTNSYNDPGSEGNSLTDTLVRTIISNAITAGRFPSDENGVYFVLTGEGVTESPPGLCGNFIGYHSAFNYKSPISGDKHTIEYAVVADVAGCPHWDGNIVNGDTTTPNGSIAADGTLNWMFHELSETVSDPEYNMGEGAWGDLPNNGGLAESGDICSFNFGTWTSLPVASNGAHYNVTIAGVNYLIQRLFQVAGGIPTAGVYYPGSCEIGKQPVTGLLSSVNPSVTGQSVTFTATVMGLDGGTPTGTVTFTKNGTDALGTAPLSSGQASITEVFQGTGTKSITATYSGDANYTSSSSPVLNQVVNNTTTSLASSLNPSLAGQSVTFTATVTPQFGGTPTGTVTFLKNGAVLGTVVLTGPQASLTVGFVGAGTRSITAAYSGDSNYTSSTSPALNQVVNLAPTTTSLVSSMNPSLAGQPVTLIATVTPQFGGTPTGTITFENSMVVLGTVALSAGQASLTTTFSGAGSKSVTAVYSGDPNYAASTSPVLNQVVNGVATTTALASSLNPSLTGESVVLTATVKGADGGTPTGTVTFQSATVVLGTAGLSGGQASLGTTFATSGTQTITAVYSGDANYNTSTSSALNQVVNHAATTSSLVSSPNPSVTGQTVTFTATVAPQFGGTPTGTATFKNGTVVLGSVVLSGGQASLSTTFAAAGMQSITATYSGDSNYASSISSALSQVVNLASTTTSLSSSTNPSRAGQSVTFTAMVAPQFGGTPTGTVTFTKSGTVVLGTVALSGGQASLSTTFAGVATQSITASYSGDLNYATSISSALSQVVNLASTTTSLSSSTNPSRAGQSVTFTAMVAPQFGGTPTGVVTFESGASVLGTVALSSGHATLSTTFAAAGTQSITSVYSGDANYTSSASAPLSEVVNQAGTTTSLGSSPNPSTAGQSVTFTATVTPQFGGTATGAVTFTKSGTVVLGTVALSGGQASLSTAFASAGTKSITAAYSGDTNYTASTSPVLNQVVH